ncbi:MerR family transcriptional regulator [Tissierella praeacuta]|uniref:MerR family transcriptional regulator n=1 Tax=Tissierella praeacuta TaxID=43131 RepID=UPI0035199F85
MKIGKFAKSNNLTIDTVRHYMDLGLIIPEMQGGHYYFDNRCKLDLEDILSLKGMGFTLNEIKSIFMFKRLGKLTPYEQHQYYKTFFESKYESIRKEIEDLKEIRNNLKKKIDELQSYNKEDKNKIGINIRNLSIFKCSKCKGDLMISKGNIDSNQLINGRLKCNCGAEYEIDDGILVSNSKDIEHRLNFNNNYIEEYINFTDIEYLDGVYKGLELIHKKINYDNFKNKIILELGSGMGFFLRHIYDELPDNSLYIAVDNDLGRHKFLKGILELINCNKNIIFICSDFTEIPIGNKFIDVLVDFSGSSNYGFVNEEFLLNKIDNYIKGSAWLIGTYIMFKNFNVNSKIDDKYRKNFNINNVRKEIEELDYKIIYEDISQLVSKGGKYEDYFVEGEEIYYYLYYGKR